MSLRLSEDYLKIIFDEDACHQSMNPGPKEYTKFSEHSVGVQILDSDDDSDLAIYLFLTANAGELIKIGAAFLVSTHENHQTIVFVRRGWDCSNVMEYRWLGRPIRS